MVNGVAAFFNDVHLMSYSTRTVLRIIKLNLFPVPVRLHSGSDKLIFRRFSIVLPMFILTVDLYENDL